MKYMPLILALILLSCVQPPIPPVVIDVPIVEQPTDPLLANDPRLQTVGAASTKWLRLPSASRGIADGDPIAAYCTDPGWSYIFFDDMAVIGYEPLPDNASVMHQAVAITVESHNMEFPDAEWDFINVIIPVTPPDTSNDPIMGVWQVCLCLDSGEIVAGPYTAEFDFNWTAFKTSIPLEVESYNLDHPNNKAHAVWGPDKE